MTITGVPETGKITVVKGVTKVVNQAMGNDSAVLRMDNTGTAEFFISEATCHSILILPENLPFNILPG